MPSAIPAAGPRRVRVVINALHARTGGGLTYIRSVLPLLADDGELDIHLFFHREQSDMFRYLDPRIQMHAFDFRSGFFSVLLWEQIALPFHARAIDADVTFSPANFGPLLPTATVVLLRNSLAVVEREVRFTKRLYWWFLALATALSVLRGRRSIAVSRYAADILTKGLPATTRRKVSVVYHGVRPSFLASEPPLAKDDFLLAVGDIYVQKNFHTLISAIAKCRSRAGAIRLKIAGRPVDKGYFADLQRRIGDLGLQGSVEFMGAVDEAALGELYRRCRVFVFPSTVETFGHPLIEAMACGAAIVSSNTAAMPEVLGDAGLYFDPLDADDLAGKLLTLWNDAMLRAEYGRRGRARAEQFSLARTAAGTARVLKEVARRTAAAAEIAPSETNAV